MTSIPAARFAQETLSLPNPPEANVCVLQPAGYVHSLGLLDPARYLASQLRRLGVTTTLTKNRLRRGAVNYVFGAHLGFDAEAAQDVHCVIVNLEQLGQGGADLPPAYTALLTSHDTVDYHRENAATYAARPSTVPLLTFGFADYLQPEISTPLRDRPIDLLFLGGLNDRRRALIAAIEATGVQVTLFDTPLFGPERDHFIRQAKAVVNLGFYESARFEQVRAFFTLSCGTPLISERRGRATESERAFEDSVLWFERKDLTRYFGQYFLSEAYYTQAAAALEAFHAHDPLDAVAALWARDSVRISPAGDPHAEPGTSGAVPVALRRIHAALECTGYRAGWLNLAAEEHLEPDAALDLSAPLTLPISLDTSRWGLIRLAGESIHEMELGLIGPWTPRLAMILGNALALLEDEGEVTLRWPTGVDVRALEPFTTRFWASGWLEHRFEVARFAPVTIEGRPCAAAEAAAIAVTLRKVRTSPWERTLSRSHLEGFRF